MGARFLDRHCICGVSETGWECIHELPPHIVLCSWFFMWEHANPNPQFGEQLGRFVHALIHNSEALDNHNGAQKTYVNRDEDKKFASSVYWNQAFSGWYDMPRRTAWIDLFQAFSESEVLQFDISGQTFQGRTLLWNKQDQGSFSNGCTQKGRTIEPTHSLDETSKWMPMSKTVKSRYLTGNNHISKAWCNTKLMLQLKYKHTQESEQECGAHAQYLFNSLLLLCYVQAAVWQGLPRIQQPMGYNTSQTLSRRLIVFVLCFVNVPNGRWREQSYGTAPLNKWLLNLPLEIGTSGLDFWPTL